MLVAAIAGFATAVQTGSDWLAFGAGALAGALMAGAFGVLVIWLNTNQYATGLALSLFGGGFSAFVGIHYTQEQLASAAALRDSRAWATSRSSGRRCSASIRWSTSRSCSCVGAGWFLYRSRAGLVLRAVGESPESAHALGYPVRRIRLIAVMVRRRAVRRGGRLHLGGLHAAVGRGHGRRQGLDRAGAHHLRHVAAVARAAGRLPVRRRHDAAVPPAGRGRGHLQPVAHDAALPRHHRGAGADLAQSAPGSAPTCRRRSASRSFPAADTRSRSSKRRFP